MPPAIENLLEKLDEDALKAALDASDALMRHKEFMPRKGLLVMLVSRFRDDVREQLEMPPERHPSHGSVFSSLDDLTSGELDKVQGAVNTLLEKRFTDVMDDPELPKQLRDFHASLIRQKTERAELQASIGTP
jgi:hypothetical protein